MSGTSLIRPSDWNHGHALQELYRQLTWLLPGCASIVHFVKLLATKMLCQALCEPLSAPASCTSLELRCVQASMPG